MSCIVTFVPEYIEENWCCDLSHQLWCWFHNVSSSLRHTNIYRGWKKNWISNYERNTFNNQIVHKVYSFIMSCMTSVNRSIYTIIIKTPGILFTGYMFTVHSRSVQKMYAILSLDCQQENVLVGIWVIDLSDGIIILYI